MENKPMAGGEGEIELFRSGDSGEAKYDEDSHMMVEDGEKRVPTHMESVKAAFLAKKAELDPVEKFRQEAKAKGGSIETALSNIREIEGMEHIDRHRAIDKHYGADSRVVAQHILDNTSEQQAIHQQVQGYIEQGKREFEAKHPEWPVGHPLREAAAKIVEKVEQSGKMIGSDKRFKGCKTIADVFERAVELARDDTPSGKIQKLLADRDQAIENWRTKKAAKATI